MKTIRGGWWEGEPEERFWLEATDRDDIGANLKAPDADQSGKDNWRYSLFKLAKPGDVVFHYHKRSDNSAIVGYSVIAGAASSQPIIWAARGTYSREKQTVPHERPGYVIPLTGYTPFEHPVTLDDLRASATEISDAMDAHAQAYRPPHYFPFELSKSRPLRLLQGYAFKLPIGFVQIFEPLSQLIGAAGAGTSKPAHIDEVTAPPVNSPRNPAWTRDELILALDLYLRSGASPPGKASIEVENLSALLNRLHAILGHKPTATLRNANGVYMKMMNFRRFDPEYVADGRTGLTRGNRDEEKVWREFADQPQRLSATATSIRSGIEQLEVGPLQDFEDDTVYEAPEGRILTRLHTHRERSKQLVQKKKSAVLQAEGRLECEACGFEFLARYGERGRGFIECHHTKPVSSLTDKSITRLDDLALLCANCHRMIHATRNWLTVDQLRAMISQSEADG